MIDLFLEKVKMTKGKGIDKQLLYSVFAYTENYKEVKYIINHLNTYCRNLPMRVYDVELAFIEDYNDAKEIFKNFANVKLNKEYMKTRQRMRYLRVIRSADTLEQVIEVLKDMTINNIEPSTLFYVEIIKRQPDYKKAKKSFEKYILIPEGERIRKWKEDENYQDGLKTILGILYLKAKNDSELNEIKAELSQCHMSTNIEDYLYLKEKSCSLVINELKKSIYSDWNVTEKIKNFISNDMDEDEEKNNINDVNILPKKEKKSYNVYRRNKNIVEYIKKLYDNTCQICGKRLRLKNGYYSEVHHLHPLYLEGADILENMIVLCPNHHVLFDNGCININLERAMVSYIDGKQEKIYLLKHPILKECIKFNNEKLFNMNKRKIANINNTVVKHKGEVILVNSITKEELKIDIPNVIGEEEFLQLRLLSHRINDNVNIDDDNYIIKDIIK